ncbi:hypothetical protein N7449_003290 [Penicillium cf. viridicatum]|uniref:Uncharacterized protein n=1 Tax=Penicillium cf. viridicatum TaxID=2972119 RepID=A0A9W9T4F1_9EURO|nr:hypothetical protein N7449_003290 [Penicillium cf. viridicatum]
MPSTKIPPLTLLLAFIDLDNELQELLHLEVAMKLYDQTVGFRNLTMMVTGAIPISDMISTKAMLGFHLEAWEQAREKEEYLERSVLARFRQLPDDMKYIFVRAHRSALNDLGL